MKLPSVEQLVRGARRTLRRFPVVLAAALTATTAGLFLVEDPGPDVWERLMVAATLGLPLLFAFTLLSERRAWSPSREAALHALGAAALVGVFVAWPGWSDQVAVRRYLQLSAGFHLVVAFLPFLGVRGQNAFWQYNRSLFLRFLTATLYAVVLFGGLALALAALEHLFGVDVSGEAYARLWILVAFLFHPWFFLAGVPGDLEALESVTEYPRGLKIFAQYVLVPLVLVYLTILTAYAIRVVGTWDWPSGWIGWLVSGVAVAGILALLLVHPVRREAENAWVRVYGRWFWVALLPSVALLLLAIWQRVSQYGITENRYFLTVLALWLAAISLFYALRRSDDIRRIPRTLAVVVLVTFLGPWSAYAVAERSQRGRLASLLARNELVADGEVRPAREPVAREDRREISATVRYLLEHHGPEAVAPAFGGRLPAGADGEDTEAEPTPESIVAALGLEYVPAWRGRGPGAGGLLRFVTAREAATRPVSGFEHVVRDVRSRAADTVDVASGLRVITGDTAVHVSGTAGATATISLAQAARRLRAEGYGGGGPVPSEEMWIEVEGPGLRAALWLESLQAREAEDGAVEIVSWSADLFLATPGEERP